MINHHNKFAELTNSELLIIQDALLEYIGSRYIYQLSNPLTIINLRDQANQEVKKRVERLIKVLEVH